MPDIPETTRVFFIAQVNLLQNLSSWWLTNPFEKYAQVKLDHFSNLRDDNKHIINNI